MVESFINMWPYLLITIPIAVAVQMSGASKYISRAFSARPLVAIVLATVVGAFSPLCSCSVIPVVAAMLIGGVPLAPVMSFWLASPSMDPEIFFLTVGTLGFELALWRLISTLVLSLSGGLAIHFLTHHGWLGKNILRDVQSTQVNNLGKIVVEVWQTLKQRISPSYGILIPATATENTNTSVPQSKVAENTAVNFDAISTSSGKSLPVIQSETTIETCCDETQSESSQCASDQCEIEPSFRTRLAKETWTATTMVIKFMMLAWLIGALIRLYVPEEWITGILGGENPWSIITAALLGVPVYTSNLTAMPLVGGLLSQGMHTAAALSFLIAGPMTTLPAMSAVWGLVNRKVFAIYIGFALVGAILLGYVYNFALLGN